MPVTSGSMELWRRVALLLGIIIGVALFFYVTPAMISITAVDWEQEQAGEAKSHVGLVTETKKRLAGLPLNEYIKEKTGGEMIEADSRQWGEFLNEVQMASNGQFDSSKFGSRVSREDKDGYLRPVGPVQVFFKPKEIPYAEWGLKKDDGSWSYIYTELAGQPAYFLLSYQDYSTSVGAMSSPYRVAPGWLFHPFRTGGIILMALGLLLYILLPRRSKQHDDISYTTFSMTTGDVAGVILLVPFYGLPFLINGGTVQAITGLWPITAAMWFLALLPVVMLYYNAWYASYRIELTPEALYIISFKGIKEFRFNEIAAIDMVVLRNPSWFRNIFLVLAFLSVASGRATSTQPAGTALLTAAAAYGGLRIKGNSGKPAYIWFGDQSGGVIIHNFDRVLKAIDKSGVPFEQEPQEIEGFSMFM